MAKLIDFLSDLSEGHEVDEVEVHINLQDIYDMYGLSIIEPDYFKQEPLAEKLKNMAASSIKNEYVRVLREILAGEVSHIVDQVGYHNEDDEYDENGDLIENGSNNNGTYTEIGEIMAQYDKKKSLKQTIKLARSWDDAGWSGQQEIIKYFLTIPTGAMYHIFKDIEWDSSYGGMNWAIIAKYTMNLEAAIDPAEIIKNIDFIHNLEHNSGSITTKMAGHRGLIQGIRAAIYNKAIPSSLPVIYSKMSKDAKDVLFDYLRFKKQSGEVLAKPEGEILKQKLEVAYDKSMHGGGFSKQLQRRYGVDNSNGSDSPQEDIKKYAGRYSKTTEGKATFQLYSMLGEGNISSYSGDEYESRRASSDLKCVSYLKHFARNIHINLASPTQEHENLLQVAITNEKWETAKQLMAMGIKLFHTDASERNFTANIFGRYKMLKSKEGARQKAFCNFMNSLKTMNINILPLVQKGMKEEMREIIKWARNKKFKKEI